MEYSRDSREYSTIPGILMKNPGHYVRSYMLGRGLFLLMTSAAIIRPAMKIIRAHV